jgi:NAD(P)-dependent dehydrogenase (short-subunit alcohol dehydrogenase family)
MTALDELALAHDRIVVTGGGSGIGRAVALSLAARGATVHVFGRRRDALESTVAMAAGASGVVVAVECDVLDEAAVERAFAVAEQDGPPTGLVHAAAQMVKMLARDMSASDFQQVVSSTLFGTFNVVRRWALPLLDRPERGSAVLLTSNSASRGTPGVAHSSAGKAGVEALVKSLAREWGPNGLTFNAVGPGPFPVEKSLAAWSDPGVERHMRDAIALGRYGELPEIVGPIVFFLTHGASYTTGQALLVDGGLSLTRWSLRPEDISAGINNDYSVESADVR